MNDNVVGLPDPYRVKPGDTLSSIARRSSKSVADLQRWNDIRNPNMINVGKVLYLSESTAFGVSVVFLDSLRHPIANLNYRLEFDDRVAVGKTGTNGLIPTQVTKDAGSTVRVWIQDAERRWTLLADTVSGYGHKLITLVSNTLAFPARAEPHPVGAPALESRPRSPTATSTQQASLPIKPDGAPTKNNPAVTTKPVKGSHGQPIVKIGVEIPQGLLNHFRQFTGKAIEEGDWKITADKLACDVNVLKAFAKVESGGRDSFWRLNNGEGAHIPALLFERHYFSRLTKRRFDNDHPDISWPAGYRQRKRLGQKDAKMHDGTIDADDVYAGYASAYLRLIQAYRLDKEAALQSCSWGKFQIMGSNFELCDTPNTVEFVDRVCKSEHAQIELMVGFIRRKPRAWKSPKNKELGKEISLLDAVKTKNWRAIAFNYNGPGYETFAYHIKLEQAYEEFSKAAQKS